MTSGKEALQPDSKWNIITWTLMTAVTLALGLASGQRVAPPSTPSSSPKDAADDAESASLVSNTPSGVPPGTNVEELQKLSQLGEPKNATEIPFPSVSSTTLTIAELAEMTDDEILQAMDAGRLSQYELEDRLEDTSRAVTIRRKHLVSGISHSFDINAIPYENYDYDQVKGKCCENVIGYVQEV
jgi:hydroxymethylglutaryl-CoA reductase (NADPH)